MKFRKKPVVIDAEPFTPLSDWATWDRRGYMNRRIGIGPDGVTYVVTECGLKTASGFVRLEKGDWICRQRVNGKLDVWPCKPDIFVATYEPVEG